MNKTVNMNLGGFFFHIDEDAYQKLNRYFDAIRASLSKEGRDEIMNDIESRISELFSEKLTSSKQVLSLKDVDDVIAVMGQPEDYKIENDEPSKANYAYTNSTSRKLYRDREEGIIGGVLAGLGHYFGIDKVWLRIIMLVLLLSFGTGFLLYIILWIVMPEAITTSEKLEMKGEPINISNIEKKVKEGFAEFSDTLNNLDHSKIATEAKNGAQKIGSTLGDIIISIMKVFAKFIGAIMVFVGGLMLISLLITLFTMGSTEYVHMPWLEYFNTFNYTNTSMWLIAFLFFLAIGIPFFFLLLLGLKILVNNLKSIGSIAKYTLLAVWISSVIALIAIGVKTSKEIAFENKVVDKTTLSISPTDTLTLKFRHNDFYAKDVDNRDDFRLVQDSLGHDYMYSNDVSLEIMPTDGNVAYIQIEKNANGVSMSEARKRATTIEYKFERVGNTLFFDNYILMDVKDKFRGQEVTIYLYLPKGTYIKPDSSLRYYDRTDGDYFTFYPESNDYIYKVESEKIKCLNCPNDIEEDWDNEEEVNINDKNTSVIINENGVQIKKDTTISTSKEIKELKINEDGIIIKTK